jgi:fatty acid desaturase
MSTPVLTAARGSDFAGLRRLVMSAQLLERRYLSYAIRIALTLAAYVGTWYVVWMVGASWWQLILGGVLGLVFTQVAFLGHDGGHQQIFRSRRNNDVLGIVAGDLMTGLSYGWWLDKHNRHHARPNHEGYDPDIGDGVLAFTTDQVAARTGAVGRFILQHQAWLFFPLLTLEGLNLHVASVGALRKEVGRRYRRTEIALFSIHLGGYLAAVYLIMGPGLGAAFIAVHQAIFGLYMGCSFAPNHKGMPMVPAGRRLDFLRSQVLTSRNVRGGPFVDFALGGLNYQVEHHLFPNMPRPRHRVSYTEVSVVGSYRAALRHLHQVAAPLRAQAAAGAVES